eukprot:1099093-Prorocentrum_minimum.AAC.1
MITTRHSSTAAGRRRRNSTSSVTRASFADHPAMAISTKLSFRKLRILARIFSSEVSSAGVRPLRSNTMVLAPLSSSNSTAYEQPQC